VKFHFLRDRDGHVKLLKCISESFRRSDEKLTQCSI